MNNIFDDYFNQNFYDNDIIIYSFIFSIFILCDGFDFGALADTPTPGFEFDQICVELTDYDDLECALIVVIATVIINENENTMIFNRDPLCTQQRQRQTHHPIAPGLNGRDRIDSISVGLTEFSDIRCILNGVIDRISLQYHMLPGMFVFIFILIFVFLFCGEMSALLC